MKRKPPHERRLPELGDRLQFPNIVFPEGENAFVHLAQAIQEYRNIDVLIYVFIFQRLESAMKEGIFYAIYRAWKYTLQSESKSLFAFVRESIIKSHNLPDFVKFTFCQIFVNKTVSHAINWLSVHTNDFLADVPIAHFSPHRHGSLYLRPRFFRFPAQI